jgi:ABC-type uncharacterized transport system substrate-binding protein
MLSIAMKKLIVPMILFAVCVSPIFAHPHVTLDARIQFEFEGNRCLGFWEDWTFDAFFSATVINDFDANRDGTFSDAESRKVHDGAFINLYKYGFFTLIRQGGKRVSPDSVERFSASVRKGRLVYRFYVPLEGKGYGNDFAVAVFDTTYYCAVRYPDDAVTMEQKVEGAPIPVWTHGVNKSYPVYYNPSGGVTDMTAYSTWKPGLETTYPDEIHVKVNS